MPTLYDLCFHDTEGYVETARGGTSRRYRSWTPRSSFFVAPMNEEDIDCFFGPALRRASGTMGKENVLGTWVCWVDVDRGDDPEWILPPNAVVWSGHGWHLYWQLDEFCTDQEAIENANKQLASQVGGDSAHNVDRVLRMPGSYNGKDSPPTGTDLERLEMGYSYTLAELMAIGGLDEKVTRKILTGDRRGFPSRSERDYAIIKELVALDLSDAAIELIFRTHACGDKYRDANTRGTNYLATSIKNARDAHPQAGGQSGRARGRATRGPITFTEKDNCYYIDDGRGRRQVSTFTFTPTMLLEGEQDFLVGDVRATSTEHVWKDVVWPRAAFGGLSQLSKELTKASWVWLGRDADIRYLLNHLVDQLTKQGIPRAVATRVLGWHKIPDADDPRSFVVATNCTLASDGSVWWDMHDAPIVYVPTERESPSFTLQELEWNTERAEQLATHLPLLNEPEVLWPALGWFMATPFKCQLEELNYRFPILNVTGTRGSGKTTLLLEVLQPLLGVLGARGYDAGTTRFVALSLLGSTNNIAVNFSEFRAAMTPEFLRFVLLSYDSGKDARGRPDQTTVTYPLSAPFTLDGEDKVSDSAALERVIVITLTPKTVVEESEAWCAMQAIQEEVELAAFALPYHAFCLQADTEGILQRAEHEVFAAFEGALPTRIRRNLTVAWFGVLAFCEFMSGYDVEIGPGSGAAVLGGALEAVYSVELGRATTAADEFAEFVVNAAAQQTHAFPWVLERGVLWFQHSPAYEYFLSRRASQRQTTLTREALKQQLRELIQDYTETPAVMDLKGRKVLAYGIDLARAHQAGLDVPESFKSSTLTIDY